MSANASFTEHPLACNAPLDDRAPVAQISSPAQASSQCASPNPVSSSTTTPSSDAVIRPAVPLSTGERGFLPPTLSNTVPTVVTPVGTTSATTVHLRAPQPDAPPASATLASVQNSAAAPPSAGQYQPRYCFAIYCSK